VCAVQHQIVDILIADIRHVHALGSGAEKSDSGEQVNGALTGRFDMRQYLCRCFMKMNLHCSIELVGKCGSCAQECLVDRIRRMRS